MKKNNLKVYAMIPARIGSERLKYKNLALIKNKPLISYAINIAKQSKIFDKIFINSDHEVFKKIAYRYNIDFYLRNKKLGSSKAKSDDVVYDFLINNSCDILIWINPIAPLQTVNELLESYKYFILKGYNSLLTVVEKNVHFLKKNKPLNFKLKTKFQKTQDLSKISEMVYTIMMWNAKTFIKFYKKNRYGILHGQICYYPVPKINSIIIKDKYDLFIVENIMSLKNTKIQNTKVKYDKILRY